MILTRRELRDKIHTIVYTLKKNYSTAFRHSELKYKLAADLKELSKNTNASVMESIDETVSKVYNIHNCQNTTDQIMCSKWAGKFLAYNRLRSINYDGSMEKFRSSMNYINTYKSNIHDELIKDIPYIIKMVAKINDDISALPNEIKIKLDKTIDGELSVGFNRHHIRRSIQSNCVKLRLEPFIPHMVSTIKEEKYLEKIMRNLKAAFDIIPLVEVVHYGRNNYSGCWELTYELSTLLLDNFDDAYIPDEVDLVEPTVAPEIVAVSKLDEIINNYQADLDRIEEERNNAYKAYLDFGNKAIELRDTIKTITNTKELLSKKL